MSQLARPCTTARGPKFYFFCPSSACASTFSPASLQDLYHCHHHRHHCLLNEARQEARRPLHPGCYPLILLPSIGLHGVLEQHITRGLYWIKLHFLR